jgi:hypothetical protein
MPLSEEEKNQIERLLDGCDAALVDKPTLSEIFTKQWRVNFREQLLKADSLMDVGCPEAYYASHMGRSGVGPSITL